MNLTSAEHSQEHSLLSKSLETTTRANQLGLPSKIQPMCLCFLLLDVQEKNVNFVHAERSLERSGISSLQREKVHT